MRVINLKISVLFLAIIFIVIVVLSRISVPGGTDEAVKPQINYDSVILDRNNRISYLLIRDSMLVDSIYKLKQYYKIKSNEKKTKYLGSFIISSDSAYKQITERYNKR